MENAIIQFIQSKELKTHEFDIFIKKQPKSNFVKLMLANYLKKNKKNYLIDNETLSKYFKRYNESVLLFLIFCGAFVSYDEAIVVEYIKAVVSNSYTSTSKLDVCYKYIIYCTDKYELLNSDYKELKDIKELIMENKVPAADYKWKSSSFTLSKEDKLCSLAHIQINYKEMPEKASKFLLDVFFDSSFTIQFLIKQLLKLYITQSTWMVFYNHFLLYRSSKVDPKLLNYVVIGLLKCSATSSQFKKQLLLLWPLLHDHMSPVQVITNIDEAYGNDLNLVNSSTKVFLSSVIPQLELNKTCFLILLKDKAQLQATLQDKIIKTKQWISDVNELTVEEYAIYDHKDAYPYTDILKIHQIKDVKDRELKLKQLNQKIYSGNEKMIVEKQIKEELNVKTKLKSLKDDSPLQKIILFIKIVLEEKVADFPCQRDIFDIYTSALSLNTLFRPCKDELVSYLLHLKCFCPIPLLHYFQDPESVDSSEVFLTVTQYKCYPIISSFTQSLLYSRVLLKPISRYLLNHPNVALYFNDIPNLLPHLFQLTTPLPLLDLLFESLTKFDENISKSLFLLLPEHPLELIVEAVSILNQYTPHSQLEAFLDLCNVSSAAYFDFKPLYHATSNASIWHLVGQYEARHTTSPVDLLNELLQQYKAALNASGRQIMKNDKSFLLTVMSCILNSHSSHICAYLKQLIVLNDKDSSELFKQYFSELVLLDKTVLPWCLSYSTSDRTQELLIIYFIKCLYRQLSTEQCQMLFSKTVQRIAKYEEHDQITAGHLLVVLWPAIKQPTTYLSVEPADLDSSRTQAVLLSSYCKSKGLKHYDPILIEDYWNSNKYLAIKCLDYHSLYFQRLFEPYFIHHLLLCLEGFGESPDCRKATNVFMQRIITTLSTTALKSMIPKCLLLIQHDQWRIRNGCCLLLQFVAHTGHSMSDLLPHIIPSLTHMTTDSHYQVCASSKAALMEYSNLIKNPELQRHSEAIMKSLSDESLVEETLSELLSTVWQHSVDASSFALLLPLLRKGLLISNKKHTLIRTCQLIGSLSKICTKDTVDALTTLLAPLKLLTEMALPEVRSYSCKAYGSIVEQCTNKMVYLESLLKELLTIHTAGMAQLTSEVFYANGVEILTDKFDTIIQQCNTHPSYILLLHYLPLAFQSLFIPFIKETLNCFFYNCKYDLDSCIKGIHVIISHYPDESIDDMLPLLLVQFDSKFQFQAIQLLQAMIVQISDFNINSKNKQSHVYDTLMSTFKKHFFPLLSRIYLNRFNPHLETRTMCTQLWKLIIVNTHAVLMECTPSLLDLLPELDQDIAMDAMRDIDTKYKGFYNVAMSYYLETENTNMLALLGHVQVPVQYILEHIEDPSIINLIKGNEEELLENDIDWTPLLPSLPDATPLVLSKYPELCLKINDATIVNNHIELLFKLYLTHSSDIMDFNAVDMYKELLVEIEEASLTLLNLICKELRQYQHISLCCVLISVLCELQPSCIVSNYDKVLNCLIMNEGKFILNTLNRISKTLPKETSNYCLKFADYIASHSLFHLTEFDFVTLLLLPNLQGSQRSICIDALFNTCKVYTNDIPMTWIGPLIRVLPDCEANGFQLMQYFLKHGNCKPFLPQLHRVLLKTLSKTPQPELYSLIGFYMTLYTRNQLFLKEIDELGYLNHVLIYPIVVDNAKEYIDQYPVTIPYLIGNLTEQDQNTLMDSLKEEVKLKCCLVLNRVYKLDKESTSVKNEAMRCFLLKKPVQNPELKTLIDRMEAKEINYPEFVHLALQ